MTEVETAGKNLVFLVGSPRSGTSWLARLMGAHSAVAATQEIELINRYCHPWYGAWDAQLPTDKERWARQRHRGLPSVLTAEEFERQATQFARGVYGNVLALKPSARVVVDKTPEYSLHVDLIRRMFPDAAVLHIVRDGRDVAGSMLAASRGWGLDWAPSSVQLAAQTWRTNVEAALGAAATGRYLQVRYEELLADGSHVLADCLAFAGVPTTAEECAGIIARFDRGTHSAGDDSLVWSGEVVKRLGGVPREPEGFFGSTSADGWQQSWSGRDRLDFHHAAGDLLQNLGYVRDDSWLRVSRVRKAGAVASRRLADQAALLGWRLHMALGRRGLYVQLGRVVPYEHDGERS